MTPEVIQSVRRNTARLVAFLLIGFAAWVNSVVWYAMYGVNWDGWFVYVTLFGCSFSFVWTVVVAGVAGSLTHMVSAVRFLIAFALFFALLWINMRHFYGDCERSVDMLSLILFYFSLYSINRCMSRHPENLQRIMILKAGSEGRLRPGMRDMLGNRSTHTPNGTRSLPPCTAMCLPGPIICNHLVPLLPFTLSAGTFYYC